MMAKFLEVTNTFIRGEIGQKVSARIETEAYKNSCEKVENFIPQVQGGLKKRNGFRFSDDSADDYDAIYSFRYSVTEDYRIYMKVFTGGQIWPPPTTGDRHKIQCRVYTNNSYSSEFFDFFIESYTIDWDLRDLEVQKLQYAQWGDILFFVDVSGKNPPFYIYRRDSDGVEPDIDGYVFEGLAWTDAVPEQVLNTFRSTERDDGIPQNNLQVWLQASTYDGLGVEISKQGLNYAKYPYIYYKVSQDLSAPVLDNFLRVDVAPEDIEFIQERYDNLIVYPSILRDDNNIHVAAMAEYNSTTDQFDCYYSTVSDVDKSADENALTYQQKKTYNTGTGTAVLTSGFLKPFNTAGEVVEVKRIGLPEWSVNNWPTSICIHQQRLVFGGTRLDPNKVWCSRTGNPFIFISQPRTYWDDEVTDATAFSFKPVSKKSDPITAMESMNTLFVCTYSSIFNVKANGPFNLRTITIDREHGTGVYPNQCVVAKERVYYIDISQRKIGSVSYIGGNNLRTEQETVTDQNPDIILLGLTREVADLLQTSIEDIFIKKILWDDHARVLWCLTSIGSIFGCSIDRDNGLLGFFRVTFPSQVLIKDMALQSNTYNTKENLWLLTTDGTLVYSDTKILPIFELEDRAGPDLTGTLTNSRYLDQENLIYMDFARKDVVVSEQISTGFPKKRVSVFEYESGLPFDTTVQYNVGDSVFHENSYYTNITPNTLNDPFNYDEWELRKTVFIGDFLSDKDGDVQLDAEHDGKEVIWGLPYNAYAKTNPIDRGKAQTMQTDMTSLGASVVKIYLSRGGRIGTTSMNTSDIDYSSYNNINETRKYTNTSEKKGDRGLSRIPYLGVFDLLEPQLFSGNIEVDLITDSQPWQGLVFEQDEPFPFYVIGAFSKGVSK